MSSILATDRPVDLIAERIDVALRVRVTLDTDAALTMRTLAKSRRILDRQARRSPIQLLIPADIAALAIATDAELERARREA